MPKSGIDTAYLKKFKQTLSKFVRSGHRFVIVTGGGATCRTYQGAARKAGVKSTKDLDWIGIAISRANAELVRSIFGSLSAEQILTDPTKPIKRSKVVVVGGWKPGWSTDYVAIRLAKRLGAKDVINLSNIKYVCDKDPNKYKSAKPIKEIGWTDFKRIVGDKWNPGANLPFDPIASKLAASLAISVMIVNGRDLNNLERILKGDKFIGTKIG